MIGIGAVLTERSREHELIVMDNKALRAWIRSINCVDLGFRGRAESI